MANSKSKNNETAANLGYEVKLWQMADALRNNMDAAEYKHVVLGLIFLKYISDAFEAKHAELTAQKKQGADPEDRDEYRAASIFWVPKEARWQHLKASAPQPTIGTLVDDAMTAIERDNPTLKGVLPKDYARPGLDKQRFGQIINLVSDIALGSAADRSKDTLGRVYEYFLSRFASAEGKSGGQFYTPSHVVRVLVEVLAPYKGRVYDPCCGSGGMFVQSEKFIEAHAGKLGDISIYGQESNYTMWRLAKMNLAIRGIDAQIAHGDTFHNDKHPDLKADYLLANPPFNDSDWRGELLKDDKRWVYGVPPAGNANYAWVQHFIHHLAPTGLAGFVLANGSMSSNQSGEGEIRKAIIEADLVDCMVALPGTGEPIEAQTFFDDKVDIHHIFPEKWCKTAKLDPGTYNSVINKTPLAARTNRQIGGRAPSKYLPVVERAAGVDSARMNEILRSHCVAPDELRSDRFWDFYATRADALLQRIEAATGKTITREPELFRAGRAAEAYDEGPEEWDGEEPLEEEEEGLIDKSSEEEGDDEGASRYELRKRFWSGLNEYLRAQFADLPEVESKTGASIRLPSDIQHIGFDLCMGLRDSYVDIDVCFWREPSYRVLEKIQEAPAEWNNLIGGTWEFESSAEKQRGWMSVWREVPNLRHESSWPEAYRWMGEKLSALYQRVAPRLREEMDRQNP